MFYLMNGKKMTELTLKQLIKCYYLAKENPPKTITIEINLTKLNTQQKMESEHLSPFLIIYFFSLIILFILLYHIGQKR